MVAKKLKTPYEVIKITTMKFVIIHIFEKVIQLQVKTPPFYFIRGIFYTGKIKAAELPYGVAKQRAVQCNR